MTPASYRANRHLTLSFLRELRSWRRQGLIPRKVAAAERHDLVRDLVAYRRTYYGA